MDPAFYLGLFIGIGSMVASILVENGELMAYMNIGAFIIIGGGTLGATTLSVGVEEMRRLPALLKIAARRYENEDEQGYIDTIISFARIARKEGLLALEWKVEELDDPFLKKSLHMVVDGYPVEKTGELLDAEIAAIKKRHARAADIFVKMGGYAPTMGIIGTVLGLVNMLMSLGDGGSGKLGGAVAVAFIATLYGILSANLIFLPIAANLKAKSEKELAYKAMVVEGVLAMQQGETPRFMEARLKIMLEPQRDLKGANK